MREIRGREGGMRITFDTNTLDKAARPERHPKDPCQSDYLKVHEALKAGGLKGHFSETIITLEGIEKKDRADVFESTRLRTESRAETDTGDSVTISRRFKVEQPSRKPLHPEVAARIQAAVAAGIRALRAPDRLGVFQITDPEGKYFVTETDEERVTRIAKCLQVGREIEGRGVGIAIAQALGEQFALRDKVQEPWFRSLVRAKDVHEENAVKRAIAEWADGDSVAAHIAYGIDLFCTVDQGKHAGSPSILDAVNQAWLTATYGVKFTTMTELAAGL
jgi:hypothetical protein